jgi:hypothetical protein
MMMMTKKGVEDRGGYAELSASDVTKRSLRTVAAEGYLHTSNGSGTKRNRSLEPSGCHGGGGGGYKRTKTRGRDGCRTRDGRGRRRERCTLLIALACASRTQLYFQDCGLGDVSLRAVEQRMA